MNEKVHVCVSVDGTPVKQESCVVAGKKCDTTADFKVHDNIRYKLELLLLSIINDDDCSVRTMSVNREMADKSNLSTANTSTDVTD